MPPTNDYFTPAIQIITAVVAIATAVSLLRERRSKLTVARSTIDTNTIESLALLNDRLHKALGDCEQKLADERARE